MPTDNPTERSKIDWVQLLPSVLYGAVALAILTAIGWGLSGNKGFLSGLADPQVARGLITFLIAITTLGIAVILAFSTIFGSDGDGGDERFDHGKQILSTLMSVLGTIVGFYFGSATLQSSASSTLSIGQVSISDTQPKKGQTFVIKASIVGGRSPYTYSIVFDDDILEPVKDMQSPDGTIKQEITVPVTVTADKDVGYKIKAKDADLKTTEYSGAQKISIKAH
jgi:hypothetical protein